MVAVGTFLELDKAPFSGGIRTHETQIFRSAAIPNLATVQLLLVPLWKDVVKSRLFCQGQRSIDAPSESQTEQPLPSTPGMGIDLQRLQVHHTSSRIENRGKKVANSDFRSESANFSVFQGAQLAFLRNHLGKGP